MISTFLSDITSPIGIEFSSAVLNTPPDSLGGTMTVGILFSRSLAFQEVEGGSVWGSSFLVEAFALFTPGAVDVNCWWDVCAGRGSAWSPVILEYQGYVEHI